MLPTTNETLHRLGTAALLTLALLACQHLSVANSLNTSTVEELTQPVAVNPSR